MKVQNTLISSMENNHSKKVSNMLAIDRDNMWLPIDNTQKKENISQSIDFSSSLWIWIENSWWFASMAKLLTYSIFERMDVVSSFFSTHSIHSFSYNSVRTRIMTQIFHTQKPEKFSQKRREQKNPIDSHLWIQSKNWSLCAGNLWTGANTKILR